MIKFFWAIILTLFLMGCGQQSTSETNTGEPKISADMILENGRLYSFSWSEPSLEGVPAPDAPYENGTWAPDGEAIAI
ncbi:MAG: hypothetical protein JKY84_05555, partial [Emcibacteraceae bacterium]|nr:hypothetical protein [Emcibacteraceae bacterium]